MTNTKTPGARFPFALLDSQDRVIGVYASQNEARTAWMAAEPGSTVASPVDDTWSVLEAARTVARQVCWLLDNGAVSMRTTVGSTVYANGTVEWT